MFHQATERPWSSWQRSLLDGGSSVGVDVRGELVQAKTPGIPPQVPTEDYRTDRRRRRQWLSNVTVPPAPSPPSPSPEPAVAATATAPPSSTAAIAVVATDATVTGSATCTAATASATAATAIDRHSTTSATTATTVAAGGVLPARPVRLQGRHGCNGSGIPSPAATATGLR